MSTPLCVLNLAVLELSQLLSSKKINVLANSSCLPVTSYSVKKHRQYVLIGGVLVDLCSNFTGLDGLPRLTPINSYYVPHAVITRRRTPTPYVCVGAVCSANGKQMRAWKHQETRPLVRYYATCRAMCRSLAAHAHATAIGSRRHLALNRPTFLTSR